jgi:pimeloyl-ACP methyl ester carboxylesterase
MSHLRRINILSAATLIALTAVACGTPSPAMTPTPVNTPLPTTTPLPATPTSKGNIDVGGYKLLYECYGEGSPTVIVEAGGGDKPVVSHTWKAVIQGVYNTTRICIYDRAEVRTSEDVARDLHVLLGKIPVQGPYIIVAHSLGGFHARVFTHLYPQDVAGLILVDTTTFYRETMNALATAYPTFSPDEAPAITRDRESLLSAPPATTFGALDLITSEEQVRQAGSLEDLPLIVISQSPGPDDWIGVDPVVGEQFAAIVLEAQADLANLSTRGVLRIAKTSNHFISLHEPQIIIDAISQMVEEFRTSTLADPTIPSASMLTYLSESGRFSIQYPPGYILYSDESPGVDGVMASLPQDSIAILSPGPPNFLLTIRHISLPESLSVEEFATQWACGNLDLTTSQKVLIEKQTALLFPELPCGPYGSSMLFLMHAKDGYVMSVESHQPYIEISGPVMQIISTFQYLNTSP